MILPVYIHSKRSVDASNVKTLTSSIQEGDLLVTLIFIEHLEQTFDIFYQKRWYSSVIC